MRRPLFILFLLAAKSLFPEVSAIYLSWYSDPTTTMTIQWLGSEEDVDDEIYLEITKGNWEPIQGSHLLLKDLTVHKASLEHLKSDTQYQFRIGNSSEVYKFRTAPSNLDKELRFIIGGDAFQQTKLFQKMNETIAALDPLFCVIGGDIAYALNGNPLRLHSTALSRWVEFLKIWKEQMVAPDGRLIPFLLVSGNHDITPDNYEVFFSLFAFPERQLYRSIDLGDYLSLILLDTGHFQPIEGRQTLWLDKTLAEKTNIPFRFAIYHIAAYPSFYPYSGETPKKIRNHWCPLFDKYKVPLAFEHHNHTFKRTHPIKNNKIAPEGVVYLGDGCWGAKPRGTNEMWYLANRARKNSVYLIHLSADKANIDAIDLNGDSFDSITINPSH